MYVFFVVFFVSFGGGGGGSENEQAHDVAFELCAYVDDDTGSSSAAKAEL